MDSLQIYCLGPPRVLLNQTPVEFGRRTTVALLVYLAVTNQPQSRATIATLRGRAARVARAGALSAEESAVVTMIELGLAAQSKRPRGAGPSAADPRHHSQSAGDKARHRQAAHSSSLISQRPLRSRAS